MNTQQIAALYASPIFNTLLRFPTFDTTTTLTKQVMLHVMRKARVVSEDSRTYRFDACHPYNREKYRNDVGERTGGFIDEQGTKRQADWLFSQLPGWPATDVVHLRKGMPEQDTLLIQVWGYGQEDDDTKTLACLRYGAREDFEVILRGMASIQRKRRKQAKKLEAQLRAYHHQQEQKHLRSGQWLGADKALTTTARVDEPGVPFLGDADLTAEQRKALKLCYWAIPQGSDMEASFPTGTGIALKQIHRSRELVEGAVYLYQCDWNTTDSTMILGRAKLADRSRGHITLHCDDRPSAFSMPLEWSNAMIKVYRVTHYTTRNAALATPRLLPNTDSLALPYQEQHQPEELACAA